MQFKKSNEEDYSIPLTSLIDVVFLLLIFFMVSTVFIDFTRKINIELPESKASDSLMNVKNIEIDMSLDKKIYINGEEIILDKLKAKLKKLSGERERRVAIIRADKGLSYGEVIKIMGICREEKIMEIGIAVK